MADLSNLQICDLAQTHERLKEVTVYQCTCAMDKADKHLEPDMKLALVEAMVAGTSPIHAMLARGYKMNVIANHMEAYGTATGVKCGIPNLS
jgi:hypothetical protein